MKLILIIRAALHALRGHRHVLPNDVTMGPGSDMTTAYRCSCGGHQRHHWTGGDFTVETVGCPRLKLNWYSPPPRAVARPRAR